MARMARSVVGLAVALAVVSPATAFAASTPTVPASSPPVTPADDQAPTGVERPAGERRIVRRPSRAHGSTVARIVAPVLARSRVRSKRRGWRLGVETAWSGQPQTLLVLRSTVHRGRQWLRVLLPLRPNGSKGWVPRDRVALARTRYWIDVRTGARRVTVYRDGKRVRRFRAVVGAPATPTPTGLAAIYERNRQPDPGAFLGPWALPLTIMSNVLENYGGGPGRVGIHGRSGASLADPLGSARSHGCIRIDNHHVAWMAASIPAGTPVRIRG
jgi:lipoprotein-anchoring transpeptidase ErfK/SrfK